MATYQPSPKQYSFLNRMTFTMDGIQDWESIDEIDNTEPSSREYRRLMRELGIKTRRPPARRLRREESWD